METPEEFADLVCPACGVAGCIVAVSKVLETNGKGVGSTERRITKYIVQCSACNLLVDQRAQTTRFTDWDSPGKMKTTTWHL